MGQQYTYSTRWEKNIVEILHIYGAGFILLLIYDHQDTESESREIEIIINQQLFIHKNISKDLWDNHIHNLQNGINLLWKFFILMELWTFSYYYVITKTLNLIHVKWKLV